jgi:hypothetical protein
MQAVVGLRYSKYSPKKSQLTEDYIQNHTSLLMLKSGFDVVN